MAPTSDQKGKRPGATALKLRGLRSVLAVSQYGSVNKAAESLNLSQPALSRAIQIIEDELGISLFERKRSGMEATDSCRILTRRIARAENHLQQAAEEIEALGEANSNKVGLSTLPRKISNRHLETICAIADYKSLTYAADQLGLSRPAVTRSLHELEEIVGTPLFRRTAHEISPTASGEILIMRGKLALSEIRQAMEEIAAFTHTVCGRLAIGTLPLSRTYLVPKAITELTAAHPDVLVSTVDGPYDELLASLRCGDIDLIVGALRNPAPVDDVREEKLFTDSLVVVSRSGHPLTHSKSLTLDDIAAADWIVPRQGTPTRGHFERLFREAGLAVPTHIVESSSLITIRTLLTESDKLALISRSQVSYDVRFGALTILPVPLEGTERPIGITVRADAFLTPGVEEFITRLRKTDVHHFETGTDIST